VSIPLICNVLDTTETDLSNPGIPPGISTDLAFWNEYISLSKEF